MYEHGNPEAPSLERMVRKCRDELKQVATQIDSNNPNLRDPEMCVFSSESR